MFLSGRRLYEKLEVIPEKEKESYLSKLPASKIQSEYFDIVMCVDPKGKCLYPRTKEALLNELNKRRDRQIEEDFTDEAEKLTEESKKALEDEAYTHLYGRGIRDSTPGIKNLNEGWEE